MRRRRTRYQWFKQPGTTGPGADQEDTDSGFDIILSVPTNGTTICQVSNLLVDLPSDEFEGSATLPMGAFTQNDYVVKRIVGKLFASRSQEGAVATTVAATLFGVGFLVARAEDLDQGGGANQPIGASSASALVDNYSPLRAENIHEPWIWRRTWILANQAATNPVNGSNQFPATTAGYGSIQDGPHIDAKVGRRVRDGERLWVAFAAKNWPLTQTDDVAASIEAHLDYRVLGAPRKNRKRSTF